MTENQTCPCCGRHCPMNDLHCGRGREYASTGIVPPRDHGQGGDDHRHRYHALDERDKLIWNLRDIGHTVRALSEGKAGQSRILILLKEAGAIPQRELTERLGVQPSSASEVIGKLESAELIERSCNRKDRRMMEIRLTQAGLEQAAIADAQRRARHGEMFSALDEREQAQLLSLLEKLNRDWRHRYPGGGMHAHHLENGGEAICGNTSEDTCTMR